MTRTRMTGTARRTLTAGIFATDVPDEPPTPREPPPPRRRDDDEEEVPPTPPTEPAPVPVQDPPSEPGGNVPQIV